MKKILIVSLNAIGDTYLSMVAIKPLLRNYPGIKIDFLIRENAAFLFKKSSSKITPIILGSGTKQLMHNLIKLRKHGYDYALSFFPGRYNSLFTYFSKAHTIAGYFNIRKITTWYLSDQKIYTNKRTSKDLIWKKKDKYIKRISLVLEAAELKSEISGEFEFPKNEYKSGAVVIHPFSSDTGRAIPHAVVKEIAEMIVNDLGRPIKIICSKAEFAAKDLIPAEFITEPSLDELYGIIRSAGVLIAVDSFPIHIADRIGIKAIGIFGPTDSKSVLFNKHHIIRLSSDPISMQPKDDLINSIRKHILKILNEVSTAAAEKN